MEQSLIEELVKELETRVDRLRALYEQYFMGIEKLEPHVPRKDVERRFQTLRKEQIRNTALRFRFQMVLQRYNTYQSYWIRICRQIEEGTYKRDVLRAKAREARAVAPETAEKEDSAFDLTGELSLLDENDIAELEQVLGPSLRTPSKPPPPPGRPRRSSSVRPPPLPRASRPPPPPIPAQAPPPVTRAASVAPPPLSQRGVSRPPPPPPAPHMATATAGGPPKPSHSRMKMLAQRLKEREAAQRLAEAEASGAPPPRLPEPPQPAPRTSLPTPVSAGRPPPPPALPRMGAGIPPPPPLAAKSPAAVPLARPAPQVPPPVQKAQQVQQAQQLARPTADLPEARLKALYSKYVDTRRQHNEPTDALTLESMARTLRESQQKLREKHAGKSVDFEVVVKDGRTVLKPIVK